MIIEDAKIKNNKQMQIPKSNRYKGNIICVIKNTTILILIAEKKLMFSVSGDLIKKKLNYTIRPTKEIFIDTVYHGLKMLEIWSNNS